MLVLARKIGQRIVIDEKIILEVHWMGRDAIRVSILEPDEPGKSLRLRTAVIQQLEPYKIRDDVSVMLLGFRANNAARLGIEAPRNVSIHREEVALRIRAEQREGIAPGASKVSSELAYAAARCVMPIATCGYIISMSVQS